MLRTEWTKEPAIQCSHVDPRWHKWRQRCNIIKPCSWARAMFPWLAPWKCDAHRSRKTL